MAEPLIAVPDDFPSVFAGTEAERLCRTLGETRVYSERGADDEAELIRRVDRARIAINIRAHARFGEGVFAACKNLAMVSVWGTGTDNIDLDAAGRRGITVCNTPGVNAMAVAEHTLALMLAAARKIPSIDAQVREGKWPREMLVQLLGKTLGVFGTGAIGARVIELGRAIGMNAMAWSARDDVARVRSLGARPASKEEILREADVVTLHLRLVTETRGFLGRKDLALMKPSAILINTARGALVEREALVAALAGRKLAGAALDVFHDEPLKAGDPITTVPGAVLSPHNAGQTPEVIRDGLLLAVQNVAKFLAGHPGNVVVAPLRRST